MAGIDISQYKSKNEPKVNPNKGSSVANLLNKDIKLFSSSFGDQKKERFYAEFHLLLSSGLDIRMTLELVQLGMKSTNDATLIQSIHDQIVAGSTLSEALKATNKFSAQEYYTVKIGEETGKLNDVLEDLRDYYSGRVKQRRQVVSALSYPMVVIASAILATLFMMNFIVPMFADVFLRFGSELPALTKAVLGVSEFFEAYILLILVVSVSLFFAVFSQREKPYMKNWSSKLLLALPVIGPLMKKIQLGRFAHNMGLLLNAKVPLVQSLNLMEKMVPFYPIQITLSQMQKDVTEGMSLHQSLAQFGIYEKRLVSLVKVGEQVNQLDTIFEQLAKQYGQDVDHSTQVLGALIEPAIIIFLAAFVGLILVAMYLPMLQLSLSFG